MNILPECLAVWPFKSHSYWSVLISDWIRCWQDRLVKLHCSVLFTSDTIYEASQRKERLSQLPELDTCSISHSVACGGLYIQLLSGKNKNWSTFEPLRFEGFARWRTRGFRLWFQPLLCYANVLYMPEWPFEKEPLWSSVAGACSGNCVPDSSKSGKSGSVQRPHENSQCFSWMNTHKSVFFTISCQSFWNLLCSLLCKLIWGIKCVRGNWLKLFV